MSLKRTEGDGSDHFRTVSSDDHWKLVESILSAGRREPEAKPDLRALRQTPFPSQLRAESIPEYRALSSSAVKEYLGDYVLAAGDGQLAGRKLTPGGTVKVFLFDSVTTVTLALSGGTLKALRAQPR